MTRTFKSRWGYHPCDYILFRKLKRIHKGYWQARRKVAAHHRWSRKLSHNRIGREPVVAEVFRQLAAHPQVVQAFHQARQPQADPALVRPLDLKPEQIERWHTALLAFDEG
jgi:hypothetical protein